MTSEQERKLFDARHQCITTRKAFKKEPQKHNQSLQSTHVTERHEEKSVLTCAFVLSLCFCLTRNDVNRPLREASAPWEILTKSKCHVEHRMIFKLADSVIWADVFFFLEAGKQWACLVNNMYTEYGFRARGVCTCLSSVHQTRPSHEN